MKITYIFLALFLNTALAAPVFKPTNPNFQGLYVTNGADLCATAKETLLYLNRGNAFDPEVIHDGKVFSVPLSKVKATLRFICEHQNELKNPEFIKSHFDFVQWLPDVHHAKQFSSNPLVAHIPQDQLLMTKYYVHLAKASNRATRSTPYALYALPNDEAHLSFEQARAMPELTRFQYGKQVILKGALEEQQVPTLAYLSREDLESALLQGTVAVEFNGQGEGGQTIYNVHRNNNIAYDRKKSPYQQERYWYFKEVEGVKGYGKDAEHKITVKLGCTFAADLPELGLGKVLMVQYKNVAGKNVHQLGILADTGGAFSNNLYQVDYLSGSYPTKEACYRENRHLPDYVHAYFMILKEKYLENTSLRPAQ